LILDEIWSIDLSRGIPRLKPSAGTAFKMWGPCLWSVALTYVLLAMTSVVVLTDPIWATISPEGKEANEIATSLMESFKR
jgi:hypothetical protein